MNNRTDAMSIMVIEHNVAIQNTLRNILSKENYHVILADSGAHALSQLESVQPDLIIQDLILPDVHYADLCQSIHNFDHGKQIPKIAVAGFLNKVDQNELNTHFCGLVLKPIENNQLIETVKSFLPPIKTRIKIGENHSILLVDDNPGQRRMMAVNLRQFGFHVETAADGMEALDSIKKFRPDILVSDVLMPGMDGFELCMKVKNNPELSHMAIILMSSQYLEEQDKKFAENAGADYYLTRSTEIDELIHALARCLYRRNNIYSKSFRNVELFDERHTKRLINQLDKQIIINEQLAQRCALQMAHLASYNNIAQILMQSNGIEKTLESVLETCLDTAGISHAALFLQQNNQDLLLKKTLGYSQEEQQNLITFIHSTDVQAKLKGTKDLIELTKDDTSACFGANFTPKFAILAPLFVESQYLGALLLSSHLIDVNHDDFISFTRNLTIQISQILALAKSIEKIYHSEQRYRLLMHSASCGIFICNREGVVLEVNKEGSKQLGNNRSQLIQKNFLDFIYSEDKPLFKQTLSAMQHHNFNAPKEIRLQGGSDKACITIEYTGVQIKTKKEALLMFLTSDVSERNRLRAQAFLNDKLAAVGKLAAGVAHEINNPTSWVMMNLTLIKESISSLNQYMQKISDIQNNQNAEVKLKLLEEFFFMHKNMHSLTEFEEMLDESIQGVERICEIVNNFKGFSRIDESEISAIDVHEILHTAINMASLEFKYRARLQTHFSEEKLMVMANQGKLNQVFLNLIINAAQAMTEANTQKNLIRVKTKRHQDFVEISIQDNGKGIPANELSQIFEPFFTTKTARHGTGLGLSICHEIISSFKGHIEVTSSPGEGSSFSVYLPLANDDEKKSNEKSQPDKKQVLIIDDEPYLLNSLSKILANHYQTITALGAKLAMNFLDKHPQVDAIVCDLQMPELNGADFYRYIVKHHPGLEKRIIFITGGLFSPSLKQFLAGINNTLLEKPFSKTALLNSLQNLCA